MTTLNKAVGMMTRSQRRDARLPASPLERKHQQVDEVVDDGHRRP